MPKSKQKHRSKNIKSKGFIRPSNLSSLQLFVFILIFGGVGTFLIIKSLATPPSLASLSWNRYGSNILNPLDGEGTPTSPVYNTTHCAWNDQDNIVNLGNGNLDGSTSNNICLVADYNGLQHPQYPKVILFNVYAASDSLDVSLTNDAGNSWHVPVSISSGNQRLWQMCVIDPVAESIGVSNETELSSLPIIPGTNGGTGKIVNYTLHITSLKGTTRKIVAYFEIGPRGNTIPRTVNTPCPA